MNSENILEIIGITKRYPGVVALDNIDLSVRRGEIHALCGENGAGKSTLIKILFGAEQSDSGQIKINGVLVDIHSPDDGKKHGISVVHQELKLAELLNVAENIFLGNLAEKRVLGIKTVDWKGVYKNANDLLQKLGVEYNLHQQVSELSVAKKQIIEIAKALSHNSDILIMDEPSASLTEKELDTLFAIIDLLKTQGITIIYISHRLDEIFKIADRVTVLRDGKLIGTQDVDKTTKGKLIEMMVGRPLGSEYPKEVCPIGEVMLQIDNLSTDILKDISFKVRRGEVLGLAGLVGAGRTEIARAVFGADKRLSGDIRILGKKIEIRNVNDAIRHKIALIPEERKSQGLVLEMTVRENITMVNLASYIKRLFISKPLERKTTRKYIDSLRIKTPGTEIAITSLSGGNQQKVVLAKWLDANCDIIFFDEPTRGIDVGAKIEIYQIINNLVRQGKAVIMISSELPEIVGMCDRVLVIHDGRIKGELQRNEATQEKIMSFAVS
jgi:ABC-type sugar transport system ATPase subunit